MLAIITGFMGMANETAKGKSFPVSSRGVAKFRRSAAPQRRILLAFIHSESQAGKFIEGPDNSSLIAPSFQHDDTGMRIGFGCDAAQVASTDLFSFLDGNTSFPDIDKDAFELGLGAVIYAVDFLPAIREKKHQMVLLGQINLMDVITIKPGLEHFQEIVKSTGLHDHSPLLFCIAEIS